MKRIRRSEFQPRFLRTYGGRYHWTQSSRFPEILIGKLRLERLSKEVQTRGTIWPLSGLMEIPDCSAARQVLLLSYLRGTIPKNNSRNSSVINSLPFGDARILVAVVADRKMEETHPMFHSEPVSASISTIGNLLFPLGAFSVEKRAKFSASFTPNFSSVFS